MTANGSTLVSPPEPSPTASKDPVVLRGRGVLALAALVVAIAQVLPAGPIRAIVVVPIVLLVPGWAAYLAIFGREQPSDPIISVTFVVVLGLGVLILNGLLVNLVGLRLSEASLTVGPAAIAAVLLTVARRRGTVDRIALPLTTARSVKVTAVSLACVLAVGAGAVRFAAGRLPAPATSAFAQLSFAPAFARTQGPLHENPSALVLLPLQVRLDGRQHIRYRVVTFVDGAQVATRHADVYAPLWEGDVKISAPTGRCVHQVQIVFAPRDVPGAKLLWLNTYISITSGARCAH